MTKEPHQCSKSLHCNSEHCHHARPHQPDGCKSPAPCGCWPGDDDFKPFCRCIPVSQVTGPEDCPDCGEPGKKGHHPSNCVKVLKLKWANKQ